MSTIDDVLDIHTDFLDRCLKDTMLTNTELLRIIHQLLTMCITFSNRLQREDTQFGMIHEDASTDVKLVEELDREFTQHVLQLLKKLQMLSARDCEQQMAHMAARLDYNSFYNTKLERQPMVTVVQHSLVSMTGTSPFTHALHTPIPLKPGTVQSTEQEAKEETGRSAFSVVKNPNRKDATQGSQLRQSEPHRGKKSVMPQSRSVPRQLPAKPKDTRQQTKPQ